MEISSHQVANIRFSLRGPGYDQVEVDEFRARVQRTLASYEAQAERLRATNGGSPTVASRDSAPSGDPSQVRGGGDQAAADLAAAKHEASRVLAAALAEGEALVAAAKARAASISPDPKREAGDLTKRLARLRTAVRDIETRLRDLVGPTLEELSLVGDLIDLETSQPAEIPALRTDSPWRRKPEPPPVAPPAAPPPPAPSRRPAPPRPVPIRGADRNGTGPAIQPADDDAPGVPGFYEKRLAGLRDRIDGIEALDALDSNDR